MPSMLIPGTGATVFHSERAVSSILRLTDASWVMQDVVLDEWRLRHTPGDVFPDLNPLHLSHVLDVIAYQAVPKPGFTRFPYDWRLDIDAHVNRLLAELRRSTEPWDLIAHSQGGLILVAASLAAGSDWNTLVHRQAIVGTPFCGTMTALRALVGDPALSLPATPAFFGELSPGWPAFFQMAPDWDGCLSVSPDLRAFHAEFWGTRGTDPEILDMLVRGAALRNRMNGKDRASPFRFIDPARILFVFGTRYPTVTAVDHAAAGGPRVDGSGPGDDTVPFELTRQFVLERGEFDPNYNIHKLAGSHNPHASLLTDPAVAQACFDFLDERWPP